MFTEARSGALKKLYPVLETVELVSNNGREFSVKAIRETHRELDRCCKQGQRRNNWYQEEHLGWMRLCQVRR